jgi:hypothetical protein
MYEVPGSATAAERQHSKLVQDRHSQLLPALSWRASSSSEQLFFPHLQMHNAQLAQL